jgi:HAMP domain-containing protein
MKETVPVIVLLSTLSIVLLIALIECMRRLLRFTQGSSSTLVLSDSQTVAATVSDLPQKPDNLFTRLSFRESLDPEKYAEASRASALYDINRELARNAADGVVVTLQSAKLLKSGAEVVVSASKAGKELLKAGKAELVRDGVQNAMPLLRDVKTGKIIETMKEAKSAKALAKVASLSTMVVGAAHIISGADIANTLKEHGAKLDLLLEYRLIDQLAALERIYTAAQELCAGPITPGKQAELWRLRGEVRELRITWRREYENLLSKIENPQSAAWYIKTFGFIQAVEKIPHQAVHDKIKEGQHHIILIDYSLRIDQALAVTSGTVREFEISLKGELDELIALSQLMKRKNSYIHEKFSDLQVQEIEKGFSNISSAYDRLLPKNC